MKQNIWQGKSRR